MDLNAITSALRAQLAQARASLDSATAAYQLASQAHSKLQGALAALEGAPAAAGVLPVALSPAVAPSPVLHTGRKLTRPTPTISRFARPLSDVPPEEIEAARERVRAWKPVVKRVSMQELLVIQDAHYQQLPQAQYRPNILHKLPIYTQRTLLRATVRHQLTQGYDEMESLTRRYGLNAEYHEFVHRPAEAAVTDAYPELATNVSTREWRTATLGEASVPPKSFAHRSIENVLVLAPTLAQAPAAVEAPAAPEVSEAPKDKAVEAARVGPEPAPAKKRTRGPTDTSVPSSTAAGILAAMGKRKAATIPALMPVLCAQAGVAFESLSKDQVKIFRNRVQVALSRLVHSGEVVQADKGLYIAT